MTDLHAYDDAMYHGEICHVEQVWDDPDGHHWAMLRPEHDSGGCYIVEQEDAGPVPGQGPIAA